MNEGHDGASQPKKHKKRTRDEGQGESVINGDSAATGKIPKEKKREAKRLKKQQKLGNGHAKDIKKEEPEINPPEDEDKAIAKVMRKAQKAQLKASRKVEEIESIDTTSIPNHSEINGDKALETAGSQEEDGSAAKAAGKAEKARIKSLKKAENHPVADNGPSPALAEEMVNGKSKKKTMKTPNISAQAEYQEDPSLTALSQTEIDSFLSKNFITINDPSSTPLRPIIQFSHLLTAATPSKPVFANFKTPTPIQSAAWPFLLSGRDVVGVAETGSGKTLAFGVPCIRSITASTPPAKGKAIAKAVIVSPTRELAVQIHTQIEELATPASLSTVCVYGGVPKDQQRAALKSAHIIVATPGRLNDLINEGAADLSAVNYLVLDEADRMLDKGFEEEIRKIISTTPSTGRQTLMFTATWPPSVRALASTFMTSPVHISIGANNPSGELRANTSITQRVEVVDPRGKEQRLLQILKQHQSGPNKKDRILVFCLYKKEAARVEGFLRQRGISVAAIHGDMNQSARETSLSNFKNGSTPLLVATDVAARGLDIPSVKLVINLTFPLTVEDYVHRIGRTGRAGAEGLAITLFTEHDKGLAGGLVNVLKGAGQDVPEELLRFGTTVKKKGHEAYGAFYKDVGEGGKKEGTKIKFDD